VSGRWEWYANFHAIPGEIYLTADEQEWAKQVGSNFILLEPNVKQTAPNKQWPFERYQALVDGLRTDHPDMRIVQPFYGGQRLAGVELVSTPNFRSALAMLARADLLVGAEGGLHHGAAAFGKPAVVIFGGYIHPRTTGYATHVNIYDPADGTPCGIAGRRCAHCKRVMASIPVEMVRRGIESFIAKRRDDVPSQRLLATGR
jgi:ADP-heptose:LPS heptosyltransferase